MNDQNCGIVRGQVPVVKCEAKEVHRRHGEQYTYILPRRHDVTAVLKRIKVTVSLRPAPQDRLKMIKYSSSLSRTPLFKRPFSF